MAKYRKYLSFMQEFYNLALYKPGLDQSGERSFRLSNGYPKLFKGT